MFVDFFVLIVYLLICLCFVFCLFVCTCIPVCLFVLFCFPCFVCYVSLFSLFCFVVCFCFVVVLLSLLMFPRKYPPLSPPYPKEGDGEGEKRGGRARKKSPSDRTSLLRRECSICRQRCRNNLMATTAFMIA